MRGSQPADCPLTLFYYSRRKTNCQVYGGKRIKGKMNNLKKLRTDKGLTQKELAERSGVKLGTLQKYESGERNIRKATIELGIALAEALSCNVPDLIDKNS